MPHLMPDRSPEPPPLAPVVNVLRPQPMSKVPDVLKQKVRQEISRQP